MSTPNFQFEGLDTQRTTRLNEALSQLVAEMKEQNPHISGGVYGRTHRYPLPQDVVEDEDMLLHLADFVGEFSISTTIRYTDDNIPEYLEVTRILES